MIKDFLQLAAEHGLSTVLLGLLLWAYKRKEDQHEEQRKAWDAERERFFEASKADSDKLAGSLLKAQEYSATIINKTGDMAASFEQEKREIREAREREIRDTGSRLPRSPR